jgi:hypothetical protein
LGLATVEIVVVGVTLAVAAGEIHAPTFVITALWFLTFVAFSRRNGLWYQRIGCGAKAKRDRLDRFHGLIAFQQRIFLQSLINLGVQLQSRQLQQPDRLLQLRRQCKVLREPELESLPHCVITF